MFRILRFSDQKKHKENIPAFISKSPERRVHHWRSIVRAADRKWRFATMFLGGTHTYQFLDLARYAAKSAYRLTGKKVVLKPLYRRDVEACARSLDAVIAALKAKGHTSILAGLDSKELSHWTVITGVSRSTLRVLDSDGFNYMFGDVATYFSSTNDGGHTWSTSTFGNTFCNKNIRGLAASCGVFSATSDRMPNRITRWRHCGTP